MKTRKTFYFVLVLTPIRGNTTYSVYTSNLFETREEALDYMNRYSTGSDHIMELVERELAVEEFDEAPTKIMPIPNRRTTF